jgi:hypothetical protein
MTHIDFKVLSDQSISTSENITFANDIDITNGSLVIGNLSVDGNMDFGTSVVQFKGFQTYLNRSLNFTSSYDFNLNNVLKINSSQQIAIPASTSIGTDKLSVAGKFDIETFQLINSAGTRQAYSGLSGYPGLCLSSYNADADSPPLIVDSKSVAISRLYYNNSTNRIGIGTDSPSSKLTVRGTLLGDINSLITDPNILMNSIRGDTEVVAWQMIGQYSSTNEGLAANWDTYTQGILLTDCSSATNKHWFITPIHDGTPTLETGVITNQIAFCYLASTTTTPVTTIAGVNTYIIGYLPIDRSGVTPAGAIDFTGQHRNLPSEYDLQFYADKVGLIVVSDGTYCETIDPNDTDSTTISINEALPKVKLSQSRNDKKVFGVISGKEDTESEKREFTAGRWVSVISKKQNDHRLIINSVGEGGIWICNINGNLENGDYITSCEIPGYGMKQEAQNIKNYTVAKITCDCDFSLSSSVYQCEEFQFSGSTYRRAFVGCTYHCG